MESTTNDRPVFEVFETGDPYSKLWDCVQYSSRADYDAGVGYWGGLSLCGTWRKDGLVRELRRRYPGCAIRNRDSGGWIVR